MMTIIYILIAVWLLKAALDVALGLFQIGTGLAAGLAGILLYALSYVVEALERLWKLAFGK
jgi:hypothetical protein